MPQQEWIPQRYELDPSCDTNDTRKLVLQSTERDLDISFSVEGVHEKLYRVTYTSKDHPLPPYPSCSRATLSSDESFTNPDGDSEKKERRLKFQNVTATVSWDKTPILSFSWADSLVPLHQDLDFRSYGFDASGVVHYTRYNAGAIHVGLGEKAAPMDLSHRHFILSASDCFGYDIHHTDPLYKHIPLLISMTPSGCVGIFSTSHSRGTWSIDSEIDGLWGYYKAYRQDYGGLEEYILLGRTLEEVVRGYAELVGYPKLIPRWALGYIAGGMKYSMLDEPRASDALLEFATKLEEHDIPCSAFQLSSGYTVAETEPKTRNVFTWNRHRFPDPKAFIDKYHDRGIRLIANVKPYVLKNHPAYHELAENNALFLDPSYGDTAIARLWSAGGGESGEGSHIDFTSKAGFEWWYDGVRGLREVGVDGIWNDNNEYTISDDRWICAGDSDDMNKTANTIASSNRTVGLVGRSLHAELMGKASHDAYIDSSPQIRPFVITRSATAGTMKYAACSWGGDNVTSWESMKGSVSLSLTAGISLLQCYGHDIGGFEGPQPSPELLLRWVQLGIHSQRFAINCFKTSSADNLVGDVIEPWMYPEITPLIRKALKRRYELAPYLYSLSLESHLFARPPQRWIGWGYESDSEVWSSSLRSEDCQYWLGSNLLVTGVFKPGESTTKVYLPKSTEKSVESFIHLQYPFKYYEAGQWVEVESSWQTSIPIFAKVGGAVPVGIDSPTYAPGGHDYKSPMLRKDDYRALEIFPPSGSSNGKIYSTTWFEDDGISRAPDISSFTVNYSTTTEELVVDVHKDPENVYIPLWKDVEIILLHGDERRVVGKDGARLTDKGVDGLSRHHYLAPLNEV